MAYNSDVRDLRGWSLAEQTANVGGNGNTAFIDSIDSRWCPSGLKAINARTSGVVTASSGYFDVGSQLVLADGSSVNYPVNGGQLLDISAYLGTHRCTARIIIGFFQANGTYFGEQASNSITGVGTTNSASLDTWNNTLRASMFVTVPEGAVSMRVRFRASNFVSSNNASYLFVSGLMIAPVSSTTQTEPSPYTVAGFTTIDGGSLITRSITANRIVAESLTADEISANAITAVKIRAGAIVAGKIAAGAVQAENISAGAVTAEKIAANAIVASNITAGAITASKLTLTDTSNSVMNGDFGGSASSGNTDGWTYIDGAISTAGDDDLGGRHRFVSSARDAAWSNYIACNPGDVIYASAMNNNQSSYNANLIIVFQTAGDEIVSFIVAASRAPNQGTWQRIEGRATAPIRTNRYRILLQSERTGTGNGSLCYWGKVQARRAGSAEMIVDGAITARTLNAASVFGDQGVFNSLRAGIATFGGLAADQISAGAIVADKIGVGLNSTNMLYGTDFLYAPQGTFAPGGAFGALQGDGLSGPTYQGIVRPDHGSAYRPYGMNAFEQFWAGSPAAGGISDLYANIPQANGSWTSLLPAVVGDRYEYSCYASAHRCKVVAITTFYDANGNPISSHAGNELVDTGGVGTMKDIPRTGGFTPPAPSNAAYIQFVVRTTTTGRDSPYSFISACYLARAKPNQTQLSDWSLGSATVVNGSTIATGSIIAAKIQANSITTDRLQAGAINVDTIAATGSISANKLAADVLTANSIKIGNGTLTSLFNGSNSTTINGGAISTNTIAANRLTIGGRAIQIAGLDFECVRDSNGNLNGEIRWSEGYLSWPNETGGTSTVRIPAGTAGVGGRETSFWWEQGASYLSWTPGGGIENAIGGNKVPMAHYWGGNSLRVQRGAGIIMDGGRLTAMSIDADKIQASAIQTKHLGANSINGDRITAGTLAASKLSAGTIDTGNINIGSGACVIDSGSRMIRMFNEYTGAEQISIGQVGRFVSGVFRPRP